MLPKKEREMLSKLRQELSHTIEVCMKAACALEYKPYLLESERVNNLERASSCRAEASKCRAALKNLRSTTYKQQRAGWGENI